MRSRTLVIYLAFPFFYVLVFRKDFSDLEPKKKKSGGILPFFLTSVSILDTLHKYRSMGEHSCIHFVFVFSG